MKKAVSNQQNLAPYFSQVGIWAFSISTAIGWGSFVVTCNAYLSQAGIFGTIQGLIVGMIFILIINHNLCHMIEQSPDSGGIYTYCRTIRGYDTGFLVGWFLLLTYLAVLWANITSLPMFARLFLGTIFQIGHMYSIFGFDVYFGEILLCIFAIIVAGLLCARNRKLPHLLVIVMTFAFVVGLTVCSVAAMSMHRGTSFTYEPMFLPNKAHLEQIIHIAAISPWAFIGFENAAMFSSEFTFPAKKIHKVMISSVVVTTLVYILMILLSVTAYPPQYASWLEYLKDMGNLQGLDALPAFFAASHYLGNGGLFIMNVSLFSVIVTSLIGNLTAISRLLFAFGRDHEWAGWLSSLNDKGLPQNAIKLVVVICCIIPLLGRTAISWIVDVTTIGATFVYLFLSIAVMQDAKQHNLKREYITGLLGTIIMSIFIVILLAPKIIAYETMVSQSYLLFSSWSLVGLLFFRYILIKDEPRLYGRSIIVWVVLLMLMLLACMMWANRMTQIATEQSMDAIQSFYAAQAPNVDPGSFLATETAKIGVTNARNTLIAFIMFLTSVAIIADNFRVANTRELKWKKELDVAITMGMTDSLTKVKNKYAYTQWEKQIDETINKGECEPMALVVCDINNLKIVNDKLGHLAGDECIRNCCMVICKTFSHSPVFRYGGDEFVVILRGEDYENRDDLVARIDQISMENLGKGTTIIATGIAVFEKDKHNSLLRVFEEADRNMYNRKKELKALEEQL